jgi:hypothetical protein
MALYVPDDGIDVAKEIAWELELRGSPPQEDQIYGALQAMNAALTLGAVGGCERRIITAHELWEVPSDEPDVEMLEDWDVAAARVENPVETGLPRQFTWFAAVAFTGFGLEVFAPVYLYPQRRHRETVLVPLDTLFVGPLAA